MTGPASLDHPLSDSAGRQLVALRAALESRLAALEEALADPSRGESLEGLILDLARAATEEAQAAASAACLDAKLDADRQIADARASAETALESERAALQSAAETLAQERAVSSDLRRAIDLAQQKIATLEREQAETRAAQDAFVKEAARERRTAAGILAELAREREAAAALRQALGEAESRLEAERASNVDLRSTVEYADQRLSAVLGENVQAQASHEQMAAELDRERAEAARAMAAMGDAERELASARSDAQALRVEVDAVRVQLEGLAAERDTIAGELQFAQRILDAQREADLALLAAGVPPPSEHAHASTHQAKPAADTLDLPGDDDGWQPVRFANRYVFREDIEIQVNGDPGRLFDISASGCQLLSPAALKPNAAVKVVLPSDQASIACTGKIVWARLEPVAAGRALGYRAGVRFTMADESAIEAFAVRRGATV